MSLFENQLNGVCFNLEYSSSFYLLELLKTLYAVVTEVIPVEISASGLVGISFTELSRVDMFYLWVWHLYGLWYLITTKSHTVSPLLYLDGIGIHECLSLNLLVSIH